MKRGLLVGTLWCVGSLAGADEVLLKTGGRVTGEIVEQTDRSVAVDIGAGVVTVPLSAVKQIKGGPAQITAYREPAARLAPGDVEGWLQLARWAQAADLRTLARAAYEHVLGVDPGNAIAHTALGDVWLGARWASAEESYRAQGLVSFEGAWVTPEQQRATLAQRAAEDQTRLRREEDDAHLREIEARARLADAEAQARQSQTRSDSGSGGIPIYGYVGGGRCVVDSPYCIDRPQRTQYHLTSTETHVVTPPHLPTPTPQPPVVTTPPHSQGTHSTRRGSALGVQGVQASRASDPGKPARDDNGD